MTQRIRIPSRPQPSQEVGSCMGCGRYDLPTEPYLASHEVFVINLGGFLARLCRSCLGDLAQQWLTGKQ